MRYCSTMQGRILQYLQIVFRLFQLRLKVLGLVSSSFPFPVILRYITLNIIRIISLYFYINFNYLFTSISLTVWHLQGSWYHSWNWIVPMQKMYFHVIPLINLYKERIEAVAYFWTLHRFCVYLLRVWHWRIIRPVPWGFLDQNFYYIS